MLFGVVIFVIRVRGMACECVVSLASSLVLDGNPLLAHVKLKSAELFSQLHSTNIEFSFAGIADTLVKQSIPPPIGLDHMLWFLLGSLRYLVKFSMSYFVQQSTSHY